MFFSCILLFTSHLEGDVSHVRKLYSNQLLASCCISAGNEHCSAPSPSHLQVPIMRTGARVPRTFGLYEPNEGRGKHFVFLRL